MGQCSPPISQSYHPASSTLQAKGLYATAQGCLCFFRYLPGLAQGRNACYLAAGSHPLEGQLPNHLMQGLRAWQPRSQSQASACTHGGTGAGASVWRTATKQSVDRGEAPASALLLVMLVCSGQTTVGQNGGRLHYHWSRTPPTACYLMHCSQPHSHVAIGALVLLQPGPEQLSGCT